MPASPTTLPDIGITPWTVMMYALPFVIIMLVATFLIDLVKARLSRAFRKKPPYQVTAKRDRRR